MDPRTNVAYLDFLTAKLDEFVAGFEEFMTMHVENTGLGAVTRGIAPAVWQREGADQARTEVITNQLNRLAGALADLSDVTNVKIVVQGFGVLDPFANWERITEPKPPLEASNVRACALQASGRLEGLRARAEAMASPNIQRSQLHPLVWAAAARLWNDGHLRLAVAAAAEAVSGQMKQLTGRNDASDTQLWQQAFAQAAPQPDKPRLRWPGKPTDQTVATMQEGLRQFAPGVNMIIRNTATHVREEPDEHVALEQLATLSVLARLVDRCEVLRAGALESPSPSGSPAHRD